MLSGGVPRLQTGRREPSMPCPLQVALTAAEQAALQTGRDHHAKPYVRKRAAAILRVAAGQVHAHLR
jgi:hypothetical protein